MFIIINVWSYLSVNICMINLCLDRCSSPFSFWKHTYSTFATPFPTIFEYFLQTKKNQRPITDRTRYIYIKAAHFENLFLTIFAPKEFKHLSFSYPSKLRDRFDRLMRMRQLLTESANTTDGNQTRFPHETIETAPIINTLAQKVELVITHLA